MYGWGGVGGREGGDRVGTGRDARFAKRGQPSAAAKARDVGPDVAPCCACQNRCVAVDPGGVTQIGDGHVRHALLVALAKHGHLIAQPHTIVRVAAHLQAHSDVVQELVVRRRDLLRPGLDVDGVAPIGDPRDDRWRTLVDQHAIDHDRYAASRLCVHRLTKHGGVGAGVVFRRAAYIARRGICEVDAQVRYFGGGGSREQRQRQH